ncbi:recombinase RecA [Candidatus Merdisoma sp. JLR.KK006]|uniref:recombinase RecA n=1 Tax=Candidatus Merdisoma sp. JLR.KK006 TaxID=3112626 RepID=UPI002FF2619E
MSTLMTVEDTFSYLNKHFGGISIKQLSELPPTKDDIVSTGIMGLDIALGVGGIKKGSIIEIYGPESGGKTTLALQMCKQYQKDKPVLYIDTERTLTKETIESMGIKEKNFYLMHVCNLEQALETCKTVGQAGTFSAIVIDSLAGLAPKAQIDGDIGDSHVGLFSRIMSDALSVLTPMLDNSGCTLIVINQIREKVGVMFGNPEKTTGGRALKYYASVRMDVRRSESIKNMGDTVGFRTNVLVSKNKLATPLKKVEFDIMFGHGISEEGDILDQAMEKDVISKSSSWYLYDGNKIGQGRENAKKYLKDNPAECKKIVTELRKVSKIA